jgi:hypothetical protein
MHRQPRLSPEERRALIEKPFPVLRVMGSLPSASRGTYGRRALNAAALGRPSMMSDDRHWVSYRGDKH